VESLTPVSPSDESRVAGLAKRDPSLVGQLTRREGRVVRLSHLHAAGAVVSTGMESHQRQLRLGTQHAYPPASRRVKRLDRELQHERRIEMSTCQSCECDGCQEEGYCPNCNDCATGSCENNCMSACEMGCTVKTEEHCMLGCEVSCAAACEESCVQSCEGSCIIYRGG